MLSFTVFVGVCLFNCLLAFALKKSCHLLLPKRYRQFSSEFCCTFIVVANVFENGNIIGAYGIWAFAVTLFLLILVYMNIFDACVNPIAVFDQVWNKKQPLWDGVVTIACQVAGGCLGARFIVILWGSLRLTGQHTSRAEFLSETCMSTNQVTLVQGMAAEMAFTVVARIAASYVVGARWEKPVNSFTGVAVVVIVFVGVCSFNCLLAFASKKSCHLLLPKRYRQFSSEFCCTFIVVANAFESGNIIGAYGIWAFAMTLFLLILVYMNIFDACVNPVTVFDQVWNKKQPLWDGVVTIACQVAGGCLGARFIVILWGSLRLTGQHASRAEFLPGTCMSTNQVTLAQGMAAEMAFTVVARIKASYFVGARWEKPVNSFTSVVVVVIGLEWTGSMINPALATAMTYNCENHPFYEHVLVYWLAPFMGSILSDYVEDILHGPGWRDRDPTPSEEPHPKASKKKRPRRSGGKSKKSASREPVVAATQKNGVSPKRRKRKEANNNVKRNMNVGS